MGLNQIELRTSKPCSEDWGAMRGDARARHCEVCAKTVHDLARMPPKDVERLALRAAAGEAVCARITRRANGELVTLEDRPGLFGARAAMAVAMVAGMPAAAQSVKVDDDPLPLCGPIPTELGAVVKGCQKVQPPADVTGRVLRPDGSPVSSGLIYVSQESKGGTLYVLDELGTFELHEEPGTYEITLQTKADEAQRISTVELHAGYQSFGDVRTRVNVPGLNDYTTYTTVGEVVLVARWSWKGRFRHPVLYAKYILRSL